MANNLHETLSALMDNEADDLELRRVLKEMEAMGDSGNAEEITELVAMKAKWHRYHVVSASLKQEIHTAPSRNLLSAIQAELAEDAVPTRSLADSFANSFADNAAGKKLFRYLGQGAIAASVALAVLFTADLAMVADADQAGSPGAQVAGNDSGSNQLPDLTGDLNPATTTRVAVQNRMDPEEMDRLQQVVSEELEDALQTRETNADFRPGQ